MTEFRGELGDCLEYEKRVRLSETLQLRCRGTVKLKCVLAAEQTYGKDTSLRFTNLDIVKVMGAREVIHKSCRV